METSLKKSSLKTTLQRVLALIATAFGVVTIIAGTKALTGTDPGYTVFKPLLIYNTMMGLFYVTAGIIAWRNAIRGKSVAAVIFILNFIVLGVIVYLYKTGNLVAVDSLRAMTLRTVVWLVQFIGLTWLSRTENPGKN